MSRKKLTYHCVSCGKRVRTARKTLERISPMRHKNCDQLGSRKLIRTFAGQPISTYSGDS